MKNKINSPRAVKSKVVKQRFKALEEPFSSIFFRLTRAFPNDLTFISIYLMNIKKRILDTPN